MKLKTLIVLLTIISLFCMGCHTGSANLSADGAQLFRGELLVMIADDFQGQSSQTLYHLLSASDGALLRLNFIKGLPDPGLTSGTVVEILGRRHNGQLDVESIRVLEQNAPSMSTHGYPLEAWSPVPFDHISIT